MSQDYNSTLNLPKTDFPMRAGLPKSEPVTLQNWEDEKVYENLMKVNEGKPLFILHDYLLMLTVTFTLAMHLIRFLRILS